jgi:hypothetical protein
MLHRVLIMKRFLRTLTCLLTAMLLAAGLPFNAAGKSYSSGGGHSYSSHSSSSGGSHSSSSHSSSSGSHSFSSGSSHSSGSSSGSSSSHGSSGTSTHSSGGGSSRSSTSTHSSGGGSTYSAGSGGGGGSSSSTGSSSAGKSYKASSGRSYSSGSSGGDSDRRSYTSGKSYSASSRNVFPSGSDSGAAPSVAKSPSPPQADSGAPSPSLTFDTAAARARKEESSKAKFNQFKEVQAPPRATPAPTATATPSYQVRPPPLPPSRSGYTRTTVYVPDREVIVTRPVRIYNVFNPYSSRPWVVYNDPYNSLFWWWLLDRSLDDRAYWAYHHRYDMDPGRYQALLATDQQLEARVEQLESQQAPRDPNYVPAGIDRDLMYSDQYVARSYSNRPTMLGVIAFWVIGVPLALGMVVFFIWLIWFKRWQTST